MQDLLHDYIASQFDQTSAELFNHGFNIRDLYVVYAYIKNEINDVRTKDIKMIIDRFDDIEIGAKNLNLPSKDLKSIRILAEQELREKNDALCNKAANKIGEVGDKFFDLLKKENKKH